MNNLQGQLVIYLVGAASIFVILFGIRGSAYIINPILLAAVITITVLPIPIRLTRRRHARLAGAGAQHPDGRSAPGVGHHHGFLLHHQAVYRAADLPGERFATSQRGPFFEPGW